MDDLCSKVAFLWFLSMIYSEQDFRINVMPEKINVNKNEHSRIFAFPGVFCCHLSLPTGTGNRAECVCYHISPHSVDILNTSHPQSHSMKWHLTHGNVCTWSIWSTFTTTSPHDRKKSSPHLDSDVSLKATGRFSGSERRWWNEDSLKQRVKSCLTAVKVFYLMTHFGGAV